MPVKKDSGPKKRNNPPPSTADFSGVQLSLFQGVLCNNEKERKNLSNTIELWDAVPKYFTSRRKSNALRHEGFLPTLEREFKHAAQTLSLTIYPARLKDAQGKDKEFYPGITEELVEDVLRKIAVEQNHGFFSQKSSRSGVSFSLYAVRRELMKRGHSRSYQEIIEALEVMARCTIAISSLDGGVFFNTSILPSLAGITHQDLHTNPKSLWYADFCPLVTESIEKLTYRQYDYDCMMSHHSQLARWLHKRMAHNYLNASLLHPYTINLSTIQRDSGLLECQKFRFALRQLESSLNELIKGNVIYCFSKEEKRGKRNKLLDATYSLTPNSDFVKHAKAANLRHSNGKRKLRS